MAPMLMLRGTTPKKLRTLGVTPHSVDRDMVSAVENRLEEASPNKFAIRPDARESPTVLTHAECSMSN